MGDTPARVYSGRVASNDREFGVCRGTSNCFIVQCAIYATLQIHVKLIRPSLKVLVASNARLPYMLENKLHVRKYICTCKLLFFSQALTALDVRVSVYLALLSTFMSVPGLEFIRLWGFHYRGFFL